LTPEIKLPAREILVSHVISSLDEYWKENTELILNLPIQDRQNSFKLSMPLKMIPIDLPNWGSSCGVQNQILVPQECVKPDESSNDWRGVDWWLAIFLMLEGWHERVWESIHGSIHSYSYRLKNWDSRVWDHAWVNRICLFLRKWYEKNFNTENDFFGNLPKSQLILSHDVDAICKTHPIRIKQSIFHFFNAFVLLLKFRIMESAVKFSKGLKFLFSNEDWWVFDRLLKIEKSAGVTAVYNFYSDTRSKNFKRWLMDPGYHVKSDRLKSLLRQLKDAGHEVGLHPTYDAWNDSELLEEQKKTLEKSLGSQVTYCRQHWLRFSWRDTWRCQANAGLQQDSTLMFNDRSGFRNSCATSWNPWDQIKGKSHSVSCITSVVMDSHLFDYNNFNDDERNNYMKIWINECMAVGGQASLLWHPQTLTKDYGWESSFISLIKELR
jgi:hypothetical protein